MDDIDAAQEREALFQSVALKRALAKPHEEKALIINGRPHCLDCEMPIPQKRLRANPSAVRCIECQTIKERG
ncbi:MAG: TraR/DksA family transcriptional regulator [Spirochaetaceae bacterium]|nr:TraR/DksA family transcriptional regulator [Spirochaetaceae bacterium]